MRRFLTNPLGFIVLSAALTACGGGAGSGSNSALPSAPSNNEPGLTIQGYSATFNEYSTPNGARPGLIAIARDGAAWFPTMNGINRITTAGAITTYRDPAFETNRGTIYGPAIARDQNGDIWFDGVDTQLCPCGGKVGHLTINGAFSGPFGPPSDNSAFIWNMSTGADGRLWFPWCSLDCLGGEQLSAVSLSGITTNYNFTFPISFGASDGLGITAGPASELYLTAVAYTGGAADYTSAIVAYSTSGTLARTYPLADSSIGANGLLGTYVLGDGITVGPDKNLWFVEDAANKIGRLTASGTLTEFPIPTPSSNPSQITSASDGALWFTEYSGNKVGRITTDGTITEIPMPTANSGPMGITACEPYGKCTAVPHARLWITENLGGKVARIDY